MLPFSDSLGTFIPRFHMETPHSFQIFIFFTVLRNSMNLKGFLFFFYDKDSRNCNKTKTKRLCVSDKSIFQMGSCVSKVRYETLCSFVLFFFSLDSCRIIFILFSFVVYYAMVRREKTKMIQSITLILPVETFISSQLKKAGMRK